MPLFSRRRRRAARSRLMTEAESERAHLIARGASIDDAIAPSEQAVDERSGHIDDRAPRAARGKDEAIRPPIASADAHADPETDGELAVDDPTGSAGTEEHTIAAPVVAAHSSEHLEETAHAPAETDDLRERDATSAEPS